MVGFIVSKVISKQNMTHSILGLMLHTLCRCKTCSLKLRDGRRLKISGSRSSGIFGIFDYVECESFSEGIFQTSEYIR